MSYDERKLVADCAETEGRRRGEFVRTCVVLGDVYTK